MLNAQRDLRRRLAGAFPDYKVSTSVPKPPEDFPQRLVTVTREGGRRLNRLIDGPGIGIYCYAPTENEASEMAEKVADFMEGLPFEAGYADVSQEVMKSDQDMLTKSPRWYLSYTFRTYEPKEA